ncbi:MAG: choline/ethanolamine kinase family protein [Steroidobacteraceae bacterium]
MIPSDILRYVPGCESGEAPLSIKPLAGGLSNRTARVHTPCGRFVVRLHSEASTNPAVDRQRELELHQHAAAAGLAPKIVAADGEGRFLVTEFIDGQGWSAANFANVADLRVLAHRLRLLHALPAPGIPCHEPMDVVHAYVATISRLAPAEVVDLAALSERGARLLDVAESTSRVSSIVHNDLDHRNLIAAGQLYLLDWEYARIADPLLDLACVLSYYPEAVRHSELLLDESGLRVQGATTAMLLALADWHLLVSYLWYRARRARGYSDAASRAAEGFMRRRLP